jgi:hypothetical protein
VGYWKRNEDDELWRKGASVFRGKFDWEPIQADDPMMEFPLIRCFIDDSDLVEITISSACIGFTYTIQKRSPGRKAINEQ